ncbi:MAG: hypothetical protein A2Y45_08785 [Tenericutes bacterium GWC2_34_14]|nr:MAG: hypothetical protein A2Z84_04655 [Tenericutes bacterium GWA2_35_7]OHE29988.1 MAG: hypothetical protein A2Y45_08785 [Tenericutes bacterium GWC2_34_14]OHE34967.1 MAG: hypothetical protein A2012_02395 [Tenericutes bacterium GWE2_34_108]OHE37173.1 MAG: hypothetical protein A2Y46_00615 [Tenericutes bacterium GWF1_35_14]OHE39695.1 MAG: hypothetical protein A2Y44_02245 [Tenericutes bacterium GWF2_35_184]OHE44117.1 MAG: hypothetical protein A2221_03265 [Tenericutes bacterium RIFOXYA2_FULL_36_3
MDKIKLVLLLAISFLLFSCQKKQDIVQFKGDAEITIEVFQVYIDPRIMMPDDFTLSASGVVNTSVLGVYEVNYEIMDNNGVLYKEMKRVINVVDTTSPSITLKGEPLLYFGLEKSLFSLFEITDNYYPIEELSLHSNLNEIASEYVDGFYEITVTAEDPKGNTAEYTFELEMKHDLFYLIEYLDQSTDDFDIYSYRGDIYFEEPVYDISYGHNLYGNLTVSKSGKFRYSTYYFFEGGIALVYLRGSFENMRETYLTVDIKTDNSTIYSRVSVESFDALVDYGELHSTMYTYTYNGDYDLNQALEVFNEYALTGINELKYFYEELLGLRLS